MGHTERIKQLLEQHPGLKAHQIASELGLDRSHVAAALHQLTGGEFIQDSAYRWWPKTREAAGVFQPGAGIVSGASVPLLPGMPDAGKRLWHQHSRGRAGYGLRRPGRIALRTTGPHLAGFRPRHQEDSAQSPPGARAIALYIGYAVRLRPVRMADQTEMRIEPVLLYPVEETLNDPLACCGRPAASRSSTWRC